MTRRSSRRRLAVRPHLLRADAGRDRRARARRRAARDPFPRAATARCASTISCTGRSSSTARTSKTSSSSDPTAIPTYHLSVVSDDVEMKITHVVRGDDHISNTPKQILLYQALGAPVPQFAHVPLILGPDKKRLSKRHGATSVMEYARAGIPARSDGELSRAARLVARSGDRELFTRDELIGGVRARRHQRRQRRLQSREARLVQPAAHRAACARRARAPREAIARGGRTVERRSTSAIGTRGSSRCSSCSSRARSGLTDFAAQGRFFFADAIEYDDGAVAKHLRVEGMRDHLTALDAAFAALPAFDPASIESALRSTAEARGVKAATLIHAVRVAVTGKAVSPGLFEVASLIGRERVPARLQARGSAGLSVAFPDADTTFPPAKLLTARWLAALARLFPRCMNAPQPVWKNFS